MKVLVLGGTGAMGKHLVSILSCSKENSVTVTTRRHRDNSGNITYIQGNAHENAFLREILCRGWDCIVDFMVYSTDEFRARVKKLLDATSQYVFLSSSRVYAASDKPLTEDSPRLLDVCDDKEYLTTDEYALRKARQEDILFDSGRRNWTIVRPYITYSEQRLQLGVMEKETWLWTALNTGNLIFSEDIASKTTTLTYGYDVARGIAALIGQDKALGEAFHITCGTPMKWMDVFRIYEKVLKESSPGIKSHIAGKTHRLNGSGKYQIVFDRYYDRTFDDTKISSFIDVTSFVTTEEGVEKCLREFLNKPGFMHFSAPDIAALARSANVRIPLDVVPGIKNKTRYLLEMSGLIGPVQKIKRAVIRQIEN